ncbi:MAG: GGDEF domain-containing protein [Pseudomonadota bacterium]
MQTEVFYVLVAMLFTSLTLSAIFFIAWKSLGHKRYALSWSVGFFAAALQWFFNIQRDWFPSWEMHWLTVNALGLGLVVLGLRGHCQRTACEHLPKNLWPYAAAVYGLIVWATVVEPHIGLRMAVLPGAAAIALFMSARLIIRFRDRPRPAEIAAASAIIICGIAQGIAAIMAFMQGPAGDADYLLIYQKYSLMTLPAFYITIGMFTILMLASDISEDMKEIAVRDQLTGTYNRRGLGEQGALAYATARRTGAPLAVIMTDIDRFKIINDKFGHAVGDSALCHFAEILNEERRATDVLARVGGEEFALVLPGTELEDAMTIADQLRLRIEARPIDVNGNPLTMTSSFGVAALNDSDTCLSDTIQRSDRALYRSKRAGRNQVDLESSQLMMSVDGTLKPVNT